MLRDASCNPEPSVDYRILNAMCCVLVTHHCVTAGKREDSALKIGDKEQLIFSLLVVFIVFFTVHRIQNAVSCRCQGVYPMSNNVSANPRLLSVIVPVYNAEFTLHRCLDSILSSSYTSLEVICVNDGSSDHSADILLDRSEKDSRVRVYRQSNKGVSAARNLAVTNARGEYITFVDADDEVEPDYFEQLVNTAVTQRACCVISGWSVVSPDGSRTCYPAPQITYKSPLPEILRVLPQGVCGHMYLSSVLQKSRILFPESIRYGEDTAFHYAQFAFCDSYASIHNVGYIVHRTPGSASSAISKSVGDMAKAVAWLEEQYSLQHWPGKTKECLLHYAAHSWRRIRSQASTQTRKNSAELLQQVLKDASPEASHWKTLKRSDRAALQSLMSGGSGLSASYYWKKLCRFLAGKQ